MHKLNRPQTAPGCLTKYRHGLHNWDNVTDQDKSEIWQALEQMQGQVCAYCEIDINRPKCHIEHFEQKSRISEKTFEWRNLFGSCDYHGRCGRYKDNQRYNSQDLIKPDIEDPEYYLVFAPNGSVSPRSNLSEDERRRASETIRVLKLDDFVIQAMRYKQVFGYVQTAEEFAEIALLYPENEWLPMLQEEIRKTSSLPFSTAIKHILTNQAV